MLIHFWNSLSANVCLSYLFKAFIDVVILVFTLTHRDDNIGEKNTKKNIIKEVEINIPVFTFKKGDKKECVYF